MSETYSIVLTGEVLPGYSAGEVAPILARMLKISDSKAIDLLSGRETVVKRNLAQGEVERYLQALKRAGVNVRSEPAVSPPSPAQKPDSGPAQAVQTLHAPAISAAGLAIVDTVSCPKCGHHQPKRNVCEACGCDMPQVLAEKEKAAQAKAEAEALESPSVFQPPKAHVADVQDEAFDPYDLELAARGQKLIIYSIVLNFFFLSAQRSVPLSAVVLLGMGIVVTAFTVNGVVKIGSGLGMGQGAKITCMVLSIFPLINLIVLIYLSHKTTGMLRRAGWRVGLFGGRP